MTVYHLICTTPDCKSSVLRSVITRRPIEFVDADIAFDLAESLNQTCNPLGVRYCVVDLEY
jgi:hypothetical protein